MVKVTAQKQRIKKINKKQNGKEFEVEKILSKKKDQKTGKTLYQIKWKGYKQTTWEPLSQLKKVKDLIKKYEDSLKGKVLYCTTKQNPKKEKKSQGKQTIKEVEKFVINGNEI